MCVMGRDCGCSSVQNVAGGTGWGISMWCKKSLSSLVSGVEQGIDSNKIGENR